MVVAQNRRGLTSALYATVLLVSSAPSDSSVGSAMTTVSSLSSTASPLTFLRLAIAVADLLAASSSAQADPSTLLSLVLLFRDNATSLGWSPSPAVVAAQSRVASALSLAVALSAAASAAFFTLLQYCLYDVSVLANNLNLGVPQLGSSGASVALNAVNPVIGYAVNSLQAVAQANTEAQSGSQAFGEGVLESWRAVSATQLDTLALGAPARTDTAVAGGLSLATMTIGSAAALAFPAWSLSSASAGLVGASVSFSGDALALSVHLNSSSAVSFEFTHSTSNVFAWKPPPQASGSSWASPPLRATLSDLVGLRVLVDSQPLSTVNTVDSAPFLVQIPLPSLPVAASASGSGLGAVQQVTCLWWNELRSAWSQEGCALQAVSGGSAQCRCVHLTFFSVQLAEYAPSAAQACTGIACAKMAPSFRALQLVLAIFGLGQLALCAFQVAVQQWALTAPRVPGRPRIYVGTLQRRLVPWILLNALLFCVQQIDPYGVDGVWPAGVRHAFLLFLNLSVQLVSLVTCAVASCVILQVSFEAQMLPFPAKVASLIYGIAVGVVVAVYTGAGIYLKYAEAGIEYAIFGVFLAADVGIMLVVNVYAVRLIIYRHTIEWKNSVESVQVLFRCDIDYDFENDDVQIEMFKLN